MRKFLASITTLVFLLAFSDGAQAAPAPMAVTIGGSIDFLAGAFHESKASAAEWGFGGVLIVPPRDRTSEDFENLYTLDFSANGKTSNGVEYGGDLVLDNAPDISNQFTGSGNSIEATTADVFVSGALGKVVLGDSRGATALNVSVPVVGEGQVTGRYIDLLDTTTFAKTFVVGIDATDHGTNITYFTPRIGNGAHKIQLGATYEPSFYDDGSSVVQQKASAGNSPYRNIIKGAAAYTGTLKATTVRLSANVINGTSNGNSGQAYNWMLYSPFGKPRDFTSWGVGAQIEVKGLSLGGAYTDLGHYDTVNGATSFSGQIKNQQQYSAGIKYTLGSLGVGVSYLGGEGYDNMLLYDNLRTINGVVMGNPDYNYVKVFNAYGVGGAYAWYNGLTTNFDGILFKQEGEDGVKNDGYVLLVSQKLAF